jgi:hypothetical protein
MIQRTQTTLQRPKIKSFADIKKTQRKETIDIYLNNNHLEQEDKIKYLGVIMDSKFKFNEHITYITDRCTKLINALSKSARINWGLKRRGTKNNIQRRNTPTTAIRSTSVDRIHEKECNKDKYVRVQRLISLRIAKAYRTTKHSAS